MSNIKTLIKVLKSVGPESCPKDINLHCHTTCSDGSLSPLELIKQARDHQVKHIAVTDHHSISSYSIMYDWLSENSTSSCEYPNLWTGIEISCILSKCLVHVIGLGFDLYHESINPYIHGQAPIGIKLQASYVVKSIHAAGGIALLAHPARYRVSFDKLIHEASSIGFDGAEAWYDYEYSSPWKPTKLICESIDSQLKKLNMLSSCGTDTHGMSLLSR